MKMKEYDLIRNIAVNFKRSRDQHNELFECDAEIITIGDRKWGISMDEFSPEEDLFTSEDSFLLGANLVVATLSDLLAAGVEPGFFLQGLSLPRNVEKEFVDGLTEGIGTMLDKAGCFMCGGDIGTADPWRFCGVAMGPVISERPLTHRMPVEPHTLWVTGAFGDANLAALQKTATPRFEFRLGEAKKIRKFATACIDTSGGFFDALWILKEQNPRMQFEVDLKDMPFAEGVVEISNRLGFPPESALLGGAGEYELLFAVPAGLAVDELLSAGMTRVGTARQGDFKGVNIHCRNGSVKTMLQPPPCPRDAINIEEHIRSVIAVSENLFNNGKCHE